MVEIGLDNIPAIGCRPSLSLLYSPTSVSFTFTFRIRFWGTLQHSSSPAPNLPLFLRTSVSVITPSPTLSPNSESQSWVTPTPVSSGTKPCWFCIPSIAWLKFRSFISAGTALTQTPIIATVSVTWSPCCQSHPPPFSPLHSTPEWSFLNPHLSWSLPCLKSFNGSPLTTRKSSFTGQTRDLNWPLASSTPLCCCSSQPLLQPHRVFAASRTCFASELWCLLFTCNDFFLLWKTPIHLSLLCSCHHLYAIFSDCPAPCHSHTVMGPLLRGSPSPFYNSSCTYSVALYC